MSFEKRGVEVMRMPDIREWIEVMRYFHGLYNVAIFSAFVYQGWMGWKIRQERLAGTSQGAFVGRHRRNGPILALLAVLGYLAGNALVYLDTGHLYAYPFHAANGAGIVVLVLAAYLMSRRIRGAASPWRTPHLAAGVLILSLYVIQAALGLAILQKLQG